MEGQRGGPFSYPEVGATREGQVPSGYILDYTCSRLGTGRKAFEAASEALRSWKMFDLGWVLPPLQGPPREGLEVCVRIRVFGFWTLNACRVVYCLDEEGPPRRRGFAYGTLRGHAETGEERFVVEWDPISDAVYYEIVAFSRPRSWWARAGRPFARRLQRRFALESVAVMEDFTTKALRRQGEFGVLL